MDNEIIEPTTEMVEKLRRALHLTREYVGKDSLPALPGWEWYDALMATGGLLEEEQTNCSNEFEESVKKWDFSEDEGNNGNTLRKEIEDILNCYSAENNSNTPSFILAEFVMDALSAFDKAVRMRSNWYGDDDVKPSGDDGWDEQYKQTDENINSN